MRRVTEEEEEASVRKEEDVTKMITYLCPLQAPPSPHLELAGSSGSEKSEPEKSSEVEKRAARTTKEASE